MYRLWLSLGMGAAGQAPDSLYPLRGGELESWASHSADAQTLFEAAGIVFDRTRPERVEVPLAPLVPLILRLDKPHGPQPHKQHALARWRWLTETTRTTLAAHGNRAVLVAW